MTVRLLMLLRHAKAKQPGGGEDFDRHLSRQGREAATELGKLIHRERLTPDLVLCSSAKRTRETWARVSEALEAEVAVRDMRGLYLAGPARIMETLRRVPDTTARVMVIAHNPGIGALASRLAGEELEFPTCALAAIAFDTARWGDIERGTLERYITP